MPRPDNYYVFEFRNTKLDDHAHFATMQLDAEANPRDYLTSLMLHNPSLRIDLDQKLGIYTSKAEADAEGKRRGEVASQANPERIDATQQFPPGELNRAIEHGTPGAEPPAG